VQQVDRPRAFATLRVACRLLVGAAIKETARLSGELVKGLSIGYAGFVMLVGLVGLAIATRFLVRRS
jgi:hypothetical protein